MSVKTVRMISFQCILITVLLFVLMFTTELPKGYLLAGAVALMAVAGFVQLACVFSKKNDK